MNTVATRFQDPMVLRMRLSGSTGDPARAPNDRSPPNPIIRLTTDHAHRISRGDSRPRTHNGASVLRRLARHCDWPSAGETPLLDGKGGVHPIHVVANQIAVLGLERHIAEQDVVAPAASSTSSVCEPGSKVSSPPTTSSCDSSTPPASESGSAPAARSVRAITRLCGKLPTFFDRELGLPVRDRVAIHTQHELAQLDRHLLGAAATAAPTKRDHCHHSEHADHRSHRYPLVCLGRATQPQSREVQSPKQCRIGQHRDQEVNWQRRTEPSQPSEVRFISR